MNGKKLVLCQSKIHIQPRHSRKIIRKADLLSGTSQRPLKPQNQALLSLDGGGLRGIISGVVLEHVESTIKAVIMEDDMLPPDCKQLRQEEWGIELADYFECVAGTSAGSMLALYIASKGGATYHTMQDRLPQDRWVQGPLHQGSMAVAWRAVRALAGTIFTPPWHFFLRFGQTSWYRALFPLLSGWLWAKYPSSGIQHCIQQLMGTQLMLSKLHTSVLVPSYDLQSSSPFTFWHHCKNPPEQSLTGYVAMRRTADIPPQGATAMTGGVQFVKGRDFKIWEVARASSAAPTYFPAAAIDTTPDDAERTMSTFVDGGIIANNPTMQGLTFMIGEMNIPMEQIAVLSIGTGTAVADLRQGVLKEGRRGWGMLEWILPNQGNIVTTIMDGTAEAGQATVEVLFRAQQGSSKDQAGKHSRLMRIQKIVDDAHPESADSVQSNRSAVELLTEIDNVSDVDRLVQLGQDLAHDNSKALQMFVRHSLFAQADM